MHNMSAPKRKLRKKKKKKKWNKLWTLLTFLVD
jgi:hypothetical protein